MQTGEQLLQIEWRLDQWEECDAAPPSLPAAASITPLRQLPKPAPSSAKRLQNSCHCIIKYATRGVSIQLPTFRLLQFTKKTG